MYIVYTKCLYCGADVYSEEIVCVHCKEKHRDDSPDGSGFGTRHNS